jgi:hypothetical protein
LVILIPLFSLAQISTKVQGANLNARKEVPTQSVQLTLKTAFQITDQARSRKKIGEKNVTIAVLDASGQIIIVTHWRRSWTTQYKAPEEKRVRIIY